MIAPESDIIGFLGLRQDGEEIPQDSYEGDHILWNVSKRTIETFIPSLEEGKRYCAVIMEREAWTTSR